MKIVNETRNELLKRKEILFILEEESNPGYGKSKKYLSDKMKVSDENIVIKTLKNNFGNKEFIVEAYIYDSKEDLSKIEPKKKEKKKKS